MNASVKSSTSVMLPNLALLFSSIYFLFVISEEAEYSARKSLYSLLVILSILTLIYLNADFIILQTIKNYVINLYRKFFKKEIKKEEKDEIKTFIEKSVKQDFGSQEKFKDNYSFVRDRGYNPSQLGPLSGVKFVNRERELLNSKTKINEKLMSGKMSSPFTFSFGENAPIMERNIPFKFNPLLINEPGLNMQSYSFNILKNLQLSQKFLTKLKLGIEISKDEIERDSDKLEITEYTDIWMSNLKSFLANNLIPDILNDHIENIDHLNQMLENSLNIRIVDSLVNDSECGNFREMLSHLIRDTSLNFSSIRGGAFDQKGMGMRPNEASEVSDYRLLKSSVEAEPKKYLNIFFGDNEKIKFIIDRLEEKIRGIQLQRERSKMHVKEMEDYSKAKLSQTLFSSAKRENVDWNQYQGMQGAKKKTYIHNPLVNKMKYDQMEDYSDLRIKYNENIEDNLKLLKQFLALRQNINNHLTPYFINSISDDHRQLILEYNVWRLQDLRSSNFSLYKNDCGGNFKGEPWFSAFPTDSQLISSVLIKYIEDIFRENNITKPFLVNYPLSPKTEKNSNSLIFYQMNGPGSQPQFNVYFEDESFNCIGGKDNFFYAAVVFFYLMKGRMTNITKKLYMDQFLNMIIKY